MTDKTITITNKLLTIKMKITIKKVQIHQQTNHQTTITITIIFIQNINNN